MAGRFRFTPACCCVGESEPSDCLTLCIPECREIFRGIGNHPRKRCDPVLDPVADVTALAITDRSFIQLDLSATYNNFSGDCSYFRVWGNPPSSARPQREKCADNHLVGGVEYGISAGCYWYFSDDLTADRCGFGLTAQTPGCIRFTSLTPGTDGGTLIGTDYIPFPVLGGTCISRRTYDFEYHEKDGLVYYDRRWVLPFIEPVCLHENETVQLSVQDDFKDYYMPLTGDPEAPADSPCRFRWVSGTCSFQTDEDGTLFSADGFKNRLDSSASGSRNPARDFFVVRLYGFIPPAMTAAGLDSDACACLEFAFTFAVMANGTTTVPVLLGDMATTDYAVTPQDYDADHDTTGHNDMPPDVEWFFGSGDDIEAARVLFGSSDTSSLNGSNTAGSPGVMPTRWRSPRTKTCPVADNNDNGSRFNGIYWIFAGMSPCGRDFPQRVTRGIVQEVPVGFFDVDIDSWNWTTYYLERPGGMRAASAPITLAKTADSFTYTDLHQGITLRNQYDSNFRYYLDVGTYGGQTWHPYITKPQNFRLSRLIWRVFRCPLGVVGKNFNTPSSDSDLEPAARCSAVSFGDLNSDPSNRPLPAELAGWKVSFGGLNTIHPYQATDAPYLPGIGHFVPGNADTDANGIVTNYGSSRGINWCESSVNGDRFLTFGPNDDPSGELTGTLYFPAISRDKLSRLLGGTLNLNVVTDAGSASYSSWFSNVTFCPVFDFSYIAVWEAEN